MPRASAQREQCDSTHKRLDSGAAVCCLKAFGHLGEHSSHGGEYHWPNEHEAVDHPKHYGGADDPFEHIKVAEALGWGYHIGNCTKYLWRAGKKSKADELEDYKKAAWYLQRKIEQLEKERA